MILSKTILILEDNLQVLSKLLDKLFVLEQDQPYDFSIIVLTTYLQVKEYVNSNPKAAFDIILLDRDCKLNESFHVFDIERFGSGKVIAISSVHKYNDDARKRGVTKVVEKDFANLDPFVEEVVGIIEEMIRKMPLVEG